MKGKVVCVTHVKELTIQEQVYLVIKLNDEGLSLKVVLYIKKRPLVLQHQGSLIVIIEVQVE